MVRVDHHIHNSASHDCGTGPSEVIGRAPSTSPLPSPGPGHAQGLQMALKRALDLALSAGLLALLSPIFLLVAIAVRTSSPGEIVFRQRRIGRDGVPFTILKFRTMVRDAPRSPLGTYCTADDPRITPAGRWLRRTSLDELPQLLNVLRGEMSFVGPRPDLPHHVQRYTPAQRGRLRVRPGITGWAQVNGRNDLSWERRIALDLEYLEGWWLGRDLRIAWRTMGTVLSRRGVSPPRSQVRMPRPGGSAGRESLPPLEAPQGRRISTHSGGSDAGESRSRPPL